MKRFWNKVKKTDDCWLWTGAKNLQGYGRFKYKGKVIGSHTFAWLLEYGKFSDQWVLHTCDNPPCVNPSHLFEGTRLDNIRDMVNKGRQKGTPGEFHHNSKLTAMQVDEMRFKYSDRKTSTAKIAQIYGVSQPMISYILIGKSWKHL